MSKPPYEPSVKEAPSTDFSGRRLKWMVSMRWAAMLGLAIATWINSAMGAVSGVRSELLIATCIGGALLNFALWHRTRVAKRPSIEGLVHALVDIGLLSVVALACGGLSTPVTGFYLLHIVLAAILAGRRGAFVAAGATLVCALVVEVAVAQYGLGGRWNPVAPWNLIVDALSFVALVGGTAHFVLHALKETRQQDRLIKTMQDQLLVETELLLQTLRELDAGLELIDAEGMLTWRNRGAKWLGDTRLLGQRWSCDEQCVNEEGCPVDLVRAGRRSAMARVARRGAEGSPERVYEMHAYRILDGERPRIMTLYLDRTKDVLAEQKLVLAERLASLGRVTQGVAHELNTPLATIRTLAADAREVVQEGVVDVASKQDVLESLQLIHDETGRLGRITRSLLAGGDFVRRSEQVTSVATVVKRAVAIVFAGDSRRRDWVHLDSHTDGAVSDPDGLTQIMVNLLQNAADAVATQGGGRIHVEATTSHDGGTLISVTDNGGGIEQSMLPQLFEPFATSKPPGEGTGLGLYTSFMLAQSMRGELKITSEAGATTATVELPFTRSEAAQ